MNIAESSASASGPAWFRSSRSGAEGGACVEGATGTAGVHVRDSEAVTGSVLTVSREAWAEFVGLASAARGV